MNKTIYESKLLSQFNRYVIVYKTNVFYILRFDDVEIFLFFFFFSFLLDFHLVLH